MSKKTYYKHCENCKYCHHRWIGLFCTLKRKDFFNGRFRALFCRFFERIRGVE